MATVKKSIKAPAKKASSVNAATKTKNAAQVSVSKAGPKSIKKEGSDKGIQKKNNHSGESEKVISSQK